MAGLTIFLFVIATVSICFVFSIVTPIVYAYDDVLTNNEFNYTKAWKLDRPVDCATISENPIVDSLNQRYNDLSHTYEDLLNIHNNITMSGSELFTTYIYPSKTPAEELYNNLTKMSYNLTGMYQDLNQIRTKISNMTSSNFENSLHCAGFNIAFELSQGLNKSLEESGDIRLVPK